MDALVEIGTKELGHQLVTFYGAKNVNPTAVYRNGQYTTVLWQDGTKTVVKRKDGDPDDPYAAFTAALAKHVYGGSTTVKTMLKKLTKTQKPRRGRNTPRSGGTDRKDTNPTDLGSDLPSTSELALEFQKIPKIPWEAN